MKWVEALKAYAAKNGGKYVVPRKGTKEYDEVKAMMGVTGATGATGGPKKTARKNPCWEGYEMYGMKEKKGKLVPNCVPKADPPKKWISEVVEHMKKGAMTKTAARHHETPLEYAKEILAHPEKHTLTMRRRAQFLVNIHKKDD